MLISLGKEREKGYCSRTRKPNRDKETESPYLVHPLTYRQVYLTKDAYFIEKIHWEFVEMAWNWCFTLNLAFPSAHFAPWIFLPALAFFFFHASWQEIRIFALFGWGKNARRSIVSIRHSVYLSGYGRNWYLCACPALCQQKQRLEFTTA